ncbi:MAG: hypothetical protein AAF226_01855 [Verrucomicrobiota bacterium]
MKVWSAIGVFVIVGVVALFFLRKDSEPQWHVNTISSDGEVTEICRFSMQEERLPGYVWSAIKDALLIEPNEQNSNWVVIEGITSEEKRHISSEREPDLVIDFEVVTTTKITFGPIQIETSDDQIELIYDSQAVQQADRNATVVSFQEEGATYLAERYREHAIRRNDE